MLQQSRARLRPGPGGAHDAGLDRAVTASERAARVTSHKNAIDAAVKAGVKHIYYTSLAFGQQSKAAVMRAHLDTEAYLRSRGVTYTIIREGVYMESYPVFLGFLGAGDDEVIVPGDGGVAWAAGAPPSGRRRRPDPSTSALDQASSWRSAPEAHRRAWLRS